MLKMNENYKDALIVILLIGIVAMTIIYANFTHYLNVNAQTGVKSSKWDIHFENLINRTTNENSNDSKINKTPVITMGKTEIVGLEASLSKPGDNIVYTFDIVNNGDFDASLDNYTIGIPQCSPSTTLCDNIIFNFKYTNGKNITKYDTLRKGERINVTMTLAISNQATSISNQKIDVTNLTGIFNYIQK